MGHAQTAPINVLRLPVYVIRLVHRTGNWCAVHRGETQEFPNRCYAECDQATDIQVGPCPDECRIDTDCSGDMVCDQNRCRPRGCGCPSAQPVMRSVARMETYTSRCQLDCDGAEIAYAGACILNPCTQNEECGFGRACLPAGGLQRSDNIARCLENASDPSCLKNVAIYPVARQDEAGAHKSGQKCDLLSVGRTRGRCLEECRPENETSQCSTAFVLASVSLSLPNVSLMPRERPRCLLSECMTDEECPGQLKCLPTFKVSSLSGLRVCK